MQGFVTTEVRSLSGGLDGVRSPLGLQQLECDRFRVDQIGCDRLCNCSDWSTITCGIVTTEVRAPLYVGAKERSLSLG